MVYGKILNKIEIQEDIMAGSDGIWKFKKKILKILKILKNPTQKNLEKLKNMLKFEKKS